MIRFVSICFIVLSLFVTVGCQNETAQSNTAQDQTASAPAAASTDLATDLAVETATAYLNAAISGDTQTAIGLYTPLAAERMKQFPLPGIEDYQFEITGVDQPAADRALVECRATTTSPSGERVNEVLCLLLARVEGNWRVSGMAFNPDPRKPPMVFDFESPDRGAVPLQNWVAEATGTAAGVRPSPSGPAADAVPTTGVYR